MSADNWDTCPKCKRTREASIEKCKAKCEQSYGKVSAQEYLTLLANLDAKKAEKPAHSLREDYQIGIDDKGEFYVLYKCRCQQCDFAFEYKHEQTVPLAGGR